MSVIRVRTGTRAPLCMMVCCFRKAPQYPWMQRPMVYLAEASVLLLTHVLFYRTIGAGL